MKKTLLCFTLISLFLASAGFAQKKGNKEMSKAEATKWFNKGSWSKGMKMKPSECINVQEFAKQFHKNPKYWALALDYLKNTNFDTVTVRKFQLDGENVFVSITEGPTKAFETTKWEAHHKYIDIQYVIKGKEKMGVAPIGKASIIDTFNDKKDQANYNVPDADSKYYEADSKAYLIFFPTEAHRPGIKVDGYETSKKVVIKIKAD